MSIDAFSSPFLWTLVAIQIAMGGFDVIFHHELTERLAWRKSAADELKLHAARNFFYAVLFGAFAWFQPHGWFAIALLIILLVEIVITLADFVEEDQTRKLPATERVLHTLLAINYGGIIALIGPEIVRWAGEPTAFVPVSYGIGSWLLSFAALGVLCFGVRDVFTGLRARNFVDAPPVSLAGLIDGRRRILVTGGTGFVGSRLVQALSAVGHDVTVLTRSLSNAGHLQSPVRLITSFDHIRNDEHFDCVVDLAGEPVAGGLWTAKRRRAILRSRLETKRALRSLIKRLVSAPDVVISASAIGVYGLRDDEILNESSSTGRTQLFSVRTCKSCEASALKTGTLGPRIVNLRIGLVLGRDGGVLSRMLPAFDLCLGGPIGSGRQWMSWIALDDLVRLIVFAIGNSTISGPVNGTAPHPVRNSEFTSALARALRRIAIIPLPAWPLEIAAGDLARELLLGGQRVVPDKVLRAGFRFEQPTIDDALLVAIWPKLERIQGAVNGVELRPRAAGTVRA